MNITLIKQISDSNFDEFSHENLKNLPNESGFFAKNWNFRSRVEYVTLTKTAQDELEEIDAQDWYDHYVGDHEGSAWENR